jgi:hypothetical protein
MKEELPLHDAAFDGIVNEDGRTILYLTRTDGIGCSVMLEGVTSLHMTDFSEGNIVMQLELTTGEAPRSNIDWERLFPALHPSAPATSHAGRAEWVTAQAEAVVQGELTLIELLPAYGAGLVALCRTATMQEHGSREVRSS